MSLAKQIERLMPNGIPRYVRCYDQPDTGDRFTVVFTGNFKTTIDGKGKSYPYLAMSSMPFHPQGIGQHGEGKNGVIDRPKSAHLGKKINFTDLPTDCQTLVIQDYKELWDLKGEECKPDKSTPSDSGTAPITAT